MISIILLSVGSLKTTLFSLLVNRGKLPDSSKLLEADDIIKLKRCILGAKVSIVADRFIQYKEQVDVFS